MKSEGTEPFWVIHEEKRVICYCDKEISDKEANIISNAPEMYEAILDFINKIDSGDGLKPKKAYNDFKAIMDRINM
jgi:hypothetical protein